MKDPYPQFAYLDEVNPRALAAILLTEAKVRTQVQMAKRFGVSHSRMWQMIQQERRRSATRCSLGRAKMRRHVAWARGLNVIAEHGVDGWQVWTPEMQMMQIMAEEMGR